LFTGTLKLADGALYALGGLLGPALVAALMVVNPLIVVSIRGLLTKK